ncbi:hypothetical protein AX17_004854 [Amanita inopinata Kibby_2008]|nr:hypothetical protein AX17_004854 [Amanita inopinata Kibby_2008]
MILDTYKMPQTQRTSRRSSPTMFTPRIQPYYFPWNKNVGSFYFDGTENHIDRVTFYGPHGRGVLMNDIVSPNVGDTVLKQANKVAFEFPKQRKIQLVVTWREYKRKAWIHEINMGPEHPTVTMVELAKMIAELYKVSIKELHELGKAYPAIPRFEEMALMSLIKTSDEEECWQAAFGTKA